MCRVAALVGVCASACGGPNGSFTALESPGELQMGEASQVIGTSLDDMWVLTIVDLTRRSLKHFDGTGWQTVDITFGGGHLNPLAIALGGDGTMLVEGDTATDSAVVRIDVTGAVLEDHTSELGLIEFGQASLMRGGHGGAFIRPVAQGPFVLVNGTFTAIAESPTIADPMHVVGPGDGYFVDGVRPGMVHHYHGDVWDTLAVPGLRAFAAVGTGSDDVWFPVDVGLEGAHGDGSTFAPYAVTGLPSSSQAVTILSTGPGRIGLLTQVDNDIVFLRLDEQLNVTTDELLAADACPDSACSTLAPSEVAQLEDGSVIFRMFAPGTPGRFYTGKIDD